MSSLEPQRKRWRGLLARRRRAWLSLLPGYCELAPLGGGLRGRAWLKGRGTVRTRVANSPGAGHGGGEAGLRRGLRAEADGHVDRLRRVINILLDGEGLRSCGRK